MEEKVDIKPITFKCYWNKDLEEVWEPRLNRIRKLSNDAELVSVIAGMRDVYVMHVYSDRFETAFDILRNNDMVYFPINKSGAYGGFSHKHLPVEPGMPYHVYGAAVRRENIKAGELFMQYSQTPSDHKKIGELLGYPECCVNFFVEKWGKPHVDPIFEAAEDTPGAVNEGNTVTVNCHPYCNDMLRYYGIRSTPHLPHSMQCEETIRWGREWHNIMGQLDPEATEWMMDLLSMPMTWNYYKGVAIIDTPIFRGVTNSNTTLDKQIVINKGWTQNL